MLRSDGLLLSLLALKKHPQARAGVQQLVRSLGRAETASAHSVGQALIRKKLLSPQEFLVLSSLVEGARHACRCGRRLVLLPGLESRKRRCRCGVVHTVPGVPGLLAPGTGSGTRRTKRGPSERSPQRGPSERASRPRGPSERTALPAAPEDSSARTKRIGRYALLERVGDGGMGTIWKALDPNGGRVVALKLLRPDASEDVKVRFQREAEALARLAHPAVVRVHDVTADERGRRFFTMEFVQGRELRELLPTMPRKALVETIAKVAEGLHHAHEHGIVHRDIKPHNIIITAEGEPKIADFGLSRDLEATSLTEMGDLVGTPLYMSPEQLRGDPSAIDRRTDVYALGVVLYEGLTGRLPIEAKSLFDLQQRMARAIPERPSKHRPDVPAELDRIALRALEKRAEDRYPTTQELARDLRAFLASQEPGTTRSQRPRRKRGLLGSGAFRLGALLAALAGVGGAALLHRQQEAERRLQAERDRAARQDTAREQLRALEQALQGVQAAGDKDQARAAAAAARAGLGQADQLRRLLDQLGPDAPGEVVAGVASARAGLARLAAEALARGGPDERDEARRLYRELLGPDTGVSDPALLAALGRLDLQDDHLPSALRHLNAALARDRERADDYWRRAEVCRRLGQNDYALLDYQAAAERQEKLVEVRPAWIHAGRARALLASGKLDAAGDAAVQALNLDGQDLEARLAQAALQVARGEAEEALAGLSPLLEGDTARDGRARRAAAEAWLAAGDPERAEAELDAALEAAPTAGAWLARARLRALRGDDAGATADLEKALLRAYPDDPVRRLTRLVQARHLRAQARLLDGLAALSEALPAALPRDKPVPPELAAHLLERMELRLLRGEAEELTQAEQDAELLLSTFPLERRPQLVRAELRLRRGEAARAQADLERLAGREAPDAQVLLLLARAQAAQKAPGAEAAARAALDAQQALLAREARPELAPGDPREEALLALLRGRRGLELLRALPGTRAAALAGVRADLQRAVRLAPWLVPARVELVRALLLAEAASEALAEAERGLQATLPAPELLALKAEALALAGRHADALAVWDEVQRRDQGEVLTQVRELPREHRHLRAEWLVRRARSAQQVGKPDQARRHLDAALEVWPDLLEALDERQALRRAAGDASGAEADLARLELLRRDARSAIEGALRQAWKAHADADQTRALAALAPAFALVDPERDPAGLAELCYARAVLRLRSLDLPGALADLGMMLQCAPGRFLELYDELGALGPGVDLEGVLDRVERGGPESSADPEFLAGFVAFLAHELGAGAERRRERGLAACERFLARRPGHFAARLLRVVLLADQGRPTRALFLLREALEEPGCPAYAHFLAARILLARRDPARALQALEQALTGGFGAWERVRSDPALAALRGQPGLERLLRLSQAAGMLARGEKLERQARAHTEDRPEVLGTASLAAGAGLGFLQELLQAGDARAAALAARLHLFRARQAYRRGQEADLGRDLCAALEADPALLLEWGQIEQAARAAARLSAGTLSGVTPREGELFPRALAPLAPILFQALAGAIPGAADVARARQALSQKPLAGTALAAACEAVILLAAGEAEPAQAAARAVAGRDREQAPLSAWLLARALATRGETAAAADALGRALAGGLRGPIARDPALSPLAEDPQLAPLLRAAAEAEVREPWDLE